MAATLPSGDAEAMIKHENVTNDPLLCF